jgi:hypothetical protein
VTYRPRLTEKKLRVPWRGICVAALRLPQRQFRVAYDITYIGSYWTNSSFDTVSCLIIFPSTEYQSFKIQEDSRREFPVFFLLTCPITYYYRLSVYVKACFFQIKKYNFSKCLFRTVVGNTLEPRRRFTEVAYSKEFAVRFFPPQLKTHSESALEAACFNYKSVVDKVPPPKKEANFLGTLLKLYLQL